MKQRIKQVLLCDFRRELSFPVPEQKPAGVGHVPALSVTLMNPYPTWPLAAGWPHKEEEGFRGEDPQSGSGISHYQYDNNNSIHLVNLR